MSFSEMKSVPTSTVIKEDFLMSFCELDRMEVSLVNYKNVDMDLFLIRDRDLSWINDDLVNIAKVYNENVSFINKEVEGFLPYRAPSFKEYIRHNPTSTRSDYDHEITLSEFKFEGRAHELWQLKQVAFLCDNLRVKILRVIAQLKQFESIAEQVPSYQLLMPSKLTLPLFKPQLRQAKEVSTISNKTPTKETLTPLEVLEVRHELKRIKASDEVLAIQEEPTTSSVIIEINQPIPTTGPSIEMTATCNLGPEFALGICCAPEWGEAPIAFTKNEKGWSGQLPLGKNWKCVALQNGQVVKWEGHWGDRHCDAQTKPFTLDVKFC